MKIFAYSLKETYAPDQPWATRLTPQFCRWFCKNKIIGYSFLLIILSILSYNIFSAIKLYLSGSPQQLDLVSAILYTIVVLISFMASAIGAQARLFFDTSPMLGESLLTPISDREYAIALHRRIVTICSLLTIPMIIFVTLIYSSFFWAEPASISAAPFRSYAIRFILYITKFYDHLLDNSMTTKILAGIVCLSMIISYGFGLYLYASIIARLCHLKPGTRLNGGLQTLLIMLGILFLMMLRHLVLVRPIMELAQGDLHMHLVIITLYEIQIILLKIVFAQRCWKYIEEKGIFTTRCLLMEKM